MNGDRRSGVFLHVTALPGRGIGTVGEPARTFVDWLEAAGQSLWQICPLGPTSGAHGNSPYQSFSAFAGNPLLVDLDELVADGWLAESDLDGADFSRHEVEYERVREWKDDLLWTAFQRFEETASAEERRAFEAYCEDTGWLDDYALFMALKGEFDGQAWVDWPAPVRQRDPDTLAEHRDDLAEQVRYRQFRQYVFDDQWADLHEYANERGVEIVGDVPIYVGLDSADVWASPADFQLDEANRPAAVAGVPPSPTDDGQRWGNPLYDWDHLRETDFEWWARRFDRLYELVDVARIDHFKGFDEYWAIPADADHPSEGEWRSAPGEELFATLEERFDGVDAIAEDHGHITPEMEALRQQFGFPGMRVAQYANWCEEDHMYQPHTYPEDVVAYPGTHDTNTVVGYYETLDDHTRSCMDYYLDTDGYEIHWDLMAAVWESDADTAIVPYQDVLGLDEGARFNTPGTLEGNWSWRVTEAGLADDLAERLRGMTDHFGRLSDQ